MEVEKEEQPTCFVIQSFDGGGKYDRRYKETIRPALLKAKVDPQRADEILGLNPVIEKIETAIESASICVAEVSEDNPNVWLELGYALALNRPTVILCDRASRSKLPFDVQHRPIIFYRTDSKSGFDELESNILKHVENQLKTQDLMVRAPTIRPGSESSTDLEPYDFAILAIAFAFWPTPVGSISHWELEKKMKSEKYTEVGLALGIANLIAKQLILERVSFEEDSDFGVYQEKHYQITPAGVDWIRAHKELLTVTAPSEKKTLNFADTEDDELPF
jgi:hypothetical protein